MPRARRYHPKRVSGNPRFFSAIWRRSEWRTALSRNRNFVSRSTRTRAYVIPRRQTLSGGFRTSNRLALASLNVGLRFCRPQMRFCNERCSDSTWHSSLHRCSWGSRFHPSDALTNGWPVACAVGADRNSSGRASCWCRSVYRGHGSAQSLNFKLRHYPL